MKIKHGTQRAYQNQKCRCAKCRKFAKERDKKYRSTEEYRKRHNAYMKAYHAKHKNDPVYRERYRKIKRKSAEKMRMIPEKWERVKDRSRSAMHKRRDMIQEIKLEKGCADCGYKAHPEALEFDHLDSSRKFSRVSRIKTLSLEMLMEEINKCEVVCANCHRIRTYNRRQKVP